MATLMAIWFRERARPAHPSLADVLGCLADAARVKGLPLPVIETDYESARELRYLLAQSIGCRLDDLLPPGWPRANRCIAMFDGVKIIARRPQSCKHEVDGWREHFGLLAEIWS
jgi:hypothetical protein